MPKDKVHAELVALADYAMNSEDKKLSLIGIFDKLFVRQLPAQHPRMAFAVTMLGEPHSEVPMQMKVTSPTGKEEFSAEVKVVFGENHKANLVSNFEGFPIKEAGTYRFSFAQAGKEVVGYNLDVIMVKEDNAKHVAN